MTCSVCGARVEAPRAAPRAATAGAAVLALGSLVLAGLAAVVVVSLPATAEGWLAPSWPRGLAALLAVTAGLLILGAWQLLRRRPPPYCADCAAGQELKGGAA